jgi:hypothetical protein
MQVWVSQVWEAGDERFEPKLDLDVEVVGAAVAGDFGGRLRRRVRASWELCQPIMLIVGAAG